MKWHQRFFWLLLLFLPTQLGFHFWPEWAMVLGRRVDYLAPTVYLTDILIGFVLFFWLMDWVKSIKGSVFSIKGKNKILFFILIGLFVILNIFVATNRPVALYKWLKVVEFVLLGWYIARTKPSFSNVATSLSIGVLYSSVLATLQFVLQHSVGGPLWWLGERTFDVGTPGIARASLCQWVKISWASCREFLRPYATFPHPNVLGGYLAVVLPLVIYQFTNPDQSRLAGPIRPMNKLMGKMYQWFLGLTFVVGIVALGLTFSRSAWVAGTIGIGVCIWYVVSRKKKHPFFPSILYTIPFILFVVAVVLTISPQEESVVVRQQLNAATISMWQHSPAVGVGLGNFLVELPRYLVSRQIYFLQPVHNIYLLVLAEAGVVGLMVFIFLIWRSIKGLVLSIKDSPTQFFINQNTIYFIPYTLFLLLGLVDHYPLTLQQGQLLLTVLVGMSILGNKSDQ